MVLAASPARAADPGPTVDRKAIVVRPDPRTGKLVRTVVGPTAPKPVISEIVEQAAKAHDVDPLLIHSVIKVESNYNPNAISPKGAEGLMQLIPSTAKMLGVRDSFDPEQNIEAGVKYLKYLQSIYKDDRLALAAYNAGPGAVSKYAAKYKDIPPYRETQNYVNQVGKHYSSAKSAAAAKKQVEAQTSEPQPVEIAEPKPPEHQKLEQFIDENGRLYLRTTQ
jgi:membrane-bound lytic murein transglycosylase MltF